MYNWFAQPFPHFLHKMKHCCPFFAHTGKLPWLVRWTVPPALTQVRVWEEWTCRREQALTCKGVHWSEGVWSVQQPGSFFLTKKRIGKDLLLQSLSMYVCVYRLELTPNYVLLNYWDWGSMQYQRKWAIHFKRNIMDSKTERKREVGKRG